MGTLISSFTFGRNALKRTIRASAEAVVRSLERADGGVDLTQLKREDNGAYNVIRDLISFLGVLARDGAGCSVTSLGETYRELYARNEEDAWRWLITRGLWRYVVPNGTNAGVNAAAQHLGSSFCFFHSLVGLLMHLTAESGARRFLYYEELCTILDYDNNWTVDARDLFAKLSHMRAQQTTFAAPQRSLLGDLETTFSIPRDNLNGVLNKAFQQTGLFEYATHDGRITGIAVSPELDRILQRRLRYALDHPASWDGSDWEAYLQARENDLPEETSALAVSELREEEPADEPVRSMASTMAADFASVNLQLDTEFVRRLAASLLAKQFMILTGLSGSGKTKIAQAFARWLCPLYRHEYDLFRPGAVIPSDRTEYTVTAADKMSVEFSGEGETLAVLPRNLIDQWVRTIRENGFTRDTSARDIREAVAVTTSYSGQINSFETHLKASAFALIDREQRSASVRHYELVPVGADWSTQDSSLGYADALNLGRYVRVTPIVDLLLRASDDPAMPYFLILDEMNLSHVEQYFAGILSAIESGESLTLHSGGDSKEELDGVPRTVSIPQNVFIIGTVNVDETTYVFSPKVLDRANSLEFRVDRDGLVTYLASSGALDLMRLDGAGRKFARSFVREAARMDVRPSDHEELVNELTLFFDVLAGSGREFGFRTAKEVARFAYFHEQITGDGWQLRHAVDAQICQKVLPKLNGSRRELEPTLCALAILCHRDRNRNESGKVSNLDELRKEALRASALDDESLHPLLSADSFVADERAGAATVPYFPVSFDKITRMLRRVVSAGFTSFAEA